MLAAMLKTNEGTDETQGDMMRRAMPRQHAGASVSSLSKLKKRSLGEIHAPSTDGRGRSGRIELRLRAGRCRVRNRSARHGRAAVSGPGPALEPVVVTGSRIPRTAIEGPAPVVIISAQDIKNNGYATVSDVMTALTQNLGAR
jgi:hypothetical protein